MMIRILIIVLIKISFSSCGQPKTEQSIKQGFNKNSVDTSMIAILPYDTTQRWISNDSKQAELSNKDLEDIEIILTKCIDDYNPKKIIEFKEIISKHPEYKFDIQTFIIDLKRYKRQYISVTNNKGERIIMINCFCGSGETYWRSSLVEVFDGGNCYFNLKINLTTKIYYELMVNGEA